MLFLLFLQLLPPREEKRALFHPFLLAIAQNNPELLYK